MAWAPVTSQRANVQGNNSTLITFPLPGAVSLNDRIVVEITQGNGVHDPTSHSMADSLGNVYNEDTFVTYVDGSSFMRASSYSCVVTVTGTPTIRCTVENPSATGFVAASAQVYTGTGVAGTSADVDVATSAQGVAVTATVTTAAATTAANELVLGGYTDDGSNVALAGKQGTGFTQRDNNSPSANSQSYIEDKDSGASGSTQTADMATNTPNGPRWAMNCVVYKLAGGAAPAPVQPLMRTLRGAGI